MVVGRTDGAGDRTIGAGQVEGIGVGSVAHSMLAAGKEMRKDQLDAGSMRVRIGQRYQMSDENQARLQDSKSLSPSQGTKRQTRTAELCFEEVGGEVQVLPSNHAPPRQ